MRALRWACFIAVCATLGCGGDTKEKDGNDTGVDTGDDMGVADDIGGGSDVGPTDMGGDDTGEPLNVNQGVGTLTVTPTSLQVSEGGASATYTIALSIEPDADVIVDIANTDESELTISANQLTFTATDFDPQTITVTAVDDAQTEQTETFTLSHTVTTSGVLYANRTLDPVIVDVLDNDSVFGTVSPTALSLGEGTSGSFDVSLGVEPTGDVTITLANDPNQVGLDATTLTFDTTNYSVPQTVTVTAIDDDFAEGPMSSIIDLSAMGGGYDALVLPSVAVAISDNDVAGIVLSKAALQTSEDGTTDTVDVSLRTQPTAQVDLLIANVSVTEGVASPAVLTFDGTNWDVPQTVTFTGLDDFVVDGSITYAPTFTGDSSDTDYDGLVEQVAVTNLDNDGALVVVTPLNLTVQESGATSQTFEVSLGSDPGTMVEFNLASSAPTQATVSASTLSFDSTNWNTPQVVTVTAVDDARCDGNTAVTIVTDPTVSASPTWDGIDPPDVVVLVIDDDGCSVTILPTTGLQVDESGTTADFSVVLTGEPTADVTVEFTSSDTTQGTVSPASVTFTSANWQTTQVVTVTGVDDDCPDGDVMFDIVTVLNTTDPAFQGINPVDVTVTNTDDDSPAPIFTPNIGFPHMTSEAGGMATFTVALVPPGCPGPSSTVTIPLSVTDNTEAMVMPASLVFNAANADIPQTVTVTGVDDNDVDGPVGFLVVLDDIVSQDPYWSGFDPSNVPMQNTDDD